MRPDPCRWPGANKGRGAKLYLLLGECVLWPWHSNASPISRQSLEVKNGRMTSVDEILERLRPMIAEHFDVDDEQILWGTDLMRDFGVDRLCVTEFLLKLEEEFGICVPDKETCNLTKISAIVQYVAFHLA
ncbi:hypothetical protein NP493_142g04004 [Ridgeia piscesae]|uniref:Acyl carrier protein n=1 Tax=Ridgeia piscesae TaxID=27915 RepID=A0AAD9P4W4_RIDPI|nr:hypothetical protein NP493_142g04004 [Ridgeia piscesae]